MLPRMLPLALTTLAVVLGLFFALWLVSLAARDASIVDMVWGAGFVVVAAVGFFLGEGAFPRRALVTAMVALWGLRLSLHLTRRNLGKGEDFRYRAMRAQHGARFPWVSLVTVFGLQALILWVVSFPVQAAQAAAGPASLGPLDFAGLAVWAVGLTFEAVGDAQLARFKADPANAGQVMDRGLWRFTRHPNYFGDCLVWWGLYGVALGADGGAFTVFAPVVMTFLLTKVSGVPLLERSLKERRPGYAAYIARTSGFFPWPPREDPPTPRA